jgi:hypothetical protein
MGLPPTPHPQASVPPPPCFWGEGNTRWRERGWESYTLISSALFPFPFPLFLLLSSLFKYSYFTIFLLSAFSIISFPSLLFFSFPFPFPPAPASFFATRNNRNKQFCFQTIKKKCCRPDTSGVAWAFYIKAHAGRHVHVQQRFLETLNRHVQKCGTKNKHTNTGAAQALLFRHVQAQLVDRHIQVQVNRHVQVRQYHTSRYSTKALVDRHVHCTLYRGSTSFHRQTFFQVQHSSCRKTCPGNTFCSRTDMSIVQWQHRLFMSSVLTPGVKSPDFQNIFHWCHGHW